MTLMYWASWHELLQVHRQEIIDQNRDRSEHSPWFSIRLWRKVDGVWLWSKDMQ